MPQVSLYIDQELLDAAKLNARFENISLSKYVSRALESSADVGWPTGYWELFGSLSDGSFVEPEDVPFDEIPIEAGLL
ncbi:MAG: toxin-antitoxin system, antitoxin component [Coriobacteriia bacterium]|nr:toxin-antitoxin system, antitoxin component [Coriobacteriia bacterium]